ncbi:MAG: hypothetical protein J0M04_06065 [Verrucomicrobia bacterium]|nr:hypothetical protein [Verrucomicrobiota bacterium]
MNKLYWIVCDDKDNNVFEGRYQGRTRGEALKFLKQSVGRKSLNGLVFTITEIPVPLIREIVAEILASGGVPATPAPNIVPLRQPDPAPLAGRFDAFADTSETTVTPAEAEPAPAPNPASAPAKKSKPKPDAGPKVGNPGHGDDLWAKIRAYWNECRSIKQTAEKFGLSPNSVKTRARREGWNK